MRKLHLLLFLCISVSVNATTYYVKNAGSNSNTGLSDAQAWQTLGHVPWNSLVAGDIVNINRGDTWREQISITSRSGTSGSWITIQAYGTGAKPKILGSVDGDAAGYWTSLGGNLWASANNSFPLETSALYYNTNLTPSNCSVNKATKDLLANNWDLFYDASAHRVIVYMSTGSPDTQANGIEIAKPFAATYNEGTVSAKWCKYLSVQDLDIRYSNSYGIKESGGNGGTGSYNTFLNCEVHYTWDKGGNLVYGDHIVVDGCVFDHCGYIGLCTAKRSSVGSWGETLWVQLITYPTVRNTEMAFPHNNGIDIWGCSNGLVENNYSHDVDVLVSPGDWETGIYLDGSSDCVVRNNLMNNLVIGISINAESSGDVAKNITCYNNIAINCDANYQVYCNQGASNHINNLKFYHNISYHDQAKKYHSGWWAGFYIANCTTVDIRNNIIHNQLSGSHLGLYIANTALTATSDYNNFYMASNSGNFHWNSGGSYATLAAFNSGTGQDAHSTALNSSFVTAGSDWHLQPGSAVIGKGIALSEMVTDFAGNNWASPPSIGVFEYNLNQQPALPVYNSSVVENAAPTIIRMTYSLSLANVVPAVSAFNVQVNSVARTISSAAIVSGKVQLTLSSAVVSGDLVTITYTAPASNPLQTGTGGLAENLSNKPVTNGCISAIPVYVSSGVENATPSRLELTYNLTLANIVPAASAFSVMVNSVARTVSSVVVSATKVQLTMESPIVFGDIVTVSYTKPSANPLQTVAGGAAITIGAQTVTNRVNSINPVYVSSAVENATPSLLVMTYNMALANIVPAASSFSVMVNSAARTVSSVVVSATNVQLTLASPIISGDVVTVSYTKPSVNPLQTTAGGQAIAITAQTVTNRVNGINPAYVSSAVENTTPLLLVMTYNITLANIVPTASAFSVLVNSVARSVSSVVVSATNVQLTLASPVFYGDVVTVSYTKPAANPLQTTAGDQAITIGVQTVTNKVIGISPVYVSSAVENAAPSLLVMTYNMTLANVAPAASSFSVMVNSVARPVNTVVISGAMVKLDLSSPVANGDVVTVAYTKPSSSPIQNVAGGQAITIVAQTVANRINGINPNYVSSSIENATPSLLGMTYNMTLANVTPAASSFSVMVNSTARAVNAVTVSGTKIQLTLTSRVFSGDIVTVSYTKPSGNPIQTTSGGIAGNITNQTVTNNCVNNAPAVTITSPVTNSVFTAQTNISITANASDNDGSVSLVEFYNGSTRLGSVSAFPYSFNWNNVPAGKYTLTAIATDNRNARTTSSSVSVTVNGSTYFGNRHPFIRIFNPRKGNIYAKLSSITIDAVASDSDGSIQKVEFFSDSVKLVELNSSPYTYTWKDVAPGKYTITAIATDNLNDTTISSPIEFEVGANVKYDGNSDLINLYPNPNNGHFSIDFVNPLVSEKGEIIITDLAGKQVYRGPVLKEETLKQFDLSNSRSGIYVMIIKDKEILVTKKFIKK